MSRAWKVDATGVLALALTTVMGYVGGVGPSIRDRAAAMQERGTLAGALTAAAEAEKDAVAAQAQLAMLEDQVRQRAIELEPLDALNTRLGKYTALAGACDLAIDEITPRTPETGTGIRLSSRVPVRLTGRGTFASVTEFVDRLSVQHRDTAVETLMVSADPSRGVGGARFSVDLIWHAAPGAPGK